MMANWLMKTHKKKENTSNITYDEAEFTASALTLESQEDTFDQKKILV